MLEKFGKGNHHFKLSKSKLSCLLKCIYFIIIIMFLFLPTFSGFLDSKNHLKVGGIPPWLAIVGRGALFGIPNADEII